MATHRDWQADAIKIAAVATAVPRWTGALLESEGVPIPDAWLGTWRVIAALLSVGMAVTEALAVNYIFGAWRSQTGKVAMRLLSLIGICLLVFALVLTPYIAAKVHNLVLTDVLGDSWLWWAWSASVAMSTFFTVGSVGYAQGRKTVETESPPWSPLPEEQSVVCPECSQLVYPPDQLARHLVVLHTSDLLEALRLLRRHGLEATESEVLAWLPK